MSWPALSHVIGCPHWTTAVLDRAVCTCPDDEDGPLRLVDAPQFATHLARTWGSDCDDTDEGVVA